MPTVSTGYQARPYFVPFHMRTQRWACLVLHRRGGKTVACVADLLDAALRCTLPNPRFAYIAPYYAQAKDTAWMYVKQMTRDIPGAEINETELRVDLPNGGRLRLYGADNYDRLRGVYLDGVVLDEYADIDPRAWPEVIRPTLSDREGWAVFIGTPKGHNAFFDLYSEATKNPAWFDLMLTVDDTNILSQGELRDVQQQLTPEQYAREYLCSFDAAIVGAYYGREIAEAEREGRVTAVPHDRTMKVHTAWDIGVGDATAIWFFQVDGPTIRIIDHYESNGRGAQHFVQELQARAEALGYDYGTDFIPHDSRVREWTSGSVPRQRLEVLMSMNRKVSVAPAHKLMDGINAARVTMARCVFDFERTRDGLEALRQYRAEYDEKSRSFADRPKHDWTSHTADAFRYLAMAWREMAPVERPKAQSEVITEITRPMTLGEMMEMADADEVA